jgi:peptidoglycan/xylan/chitin deacetylase (PgdA/CDA1 family)
MYRSKRADRKYLMSWLKIAAVFVVLFLIGGVVALGQNWIFADYDEEELTASASLPLTEFLESTYSFEPEVYQLSADIFVVEDSNYGVLGVYEEYTQRDFFHVSIHDADESRAPMIALTFDDGPSIFTRELLDILDEHGGRVTFCVLGNLVEIGAATIIRAFESGHEILGHSWDHSDLSRLSVENIMTQIQRTSAIIDAVTGEPPPPLFRVPFGAYNRRIAEAATELGYGVLNWGIDPRDWQFRDEDHIFDYIMEHARDGAIVVLHDVHQTTVDAMARVIPALIEQGFQLVTASEIIFYVYGSLEPGFEFTGTRR